MVEGLNTVVNNVLYVHYCGSCFLIFIKSMLNEMCHMIHFAFS